MAIFFLLAMVSVGFAKPMAPPGVNNIINELVLFEQNYEKRDLTAATISANKIDNELLGVLVAAEVEDEALENSLVSLKGAIIEENYQKIEANFIFFQKRFYVFLNNFEYKEHPVIARIERGLIVESADMLNENNISGIAGEMAEIANLVMQSKSQFKAMGVNEDAVNTFNKKIMGVLRAAKQNDGKQVAKLLPELQAFYKSLFSNAI